MKVLVATRRTQGERPGDFNWTIDGELVHFPIVVCALDQKATKAGKPLGGCGCGRSFAGMNSHRAGTTAEVADLDISRDDFITALASSLHAGGWIPREDRSRADIRMAASELLDLAEAFPVGTVLGHQLYDVVRR